MNTSIARLRWECRRGMLELDLILLPFVENKFATLSADEQAIFIKLLACTDQDLYGWFIGHQQSDDPELAQMVAKVRGRA